VITSQLQVMAANDRMAAKTVGSIAKKYRRETIQPLVADIEKAGSIKELKKRLPGLIGKMKTDALEAALVAVDVQGAMIGRITTQGTSKSRGKSRNIKKSKRPNGERGTGNAKR